jgi:chitin disaccharide deacetylase
MNMHKPTAPPRILSLCIDDFGQSPGIAAAVVQLAQAGRISAVSCMSNVPGWQRDAPLLRTLPPSVAIGLHLNLTDGAPLSTNLSRSWPRLPSLPRLMLRAHLHFLPRNALQHEIAAQWQAFVAATGRSPDFVDGHQHVHHLPGVRDAMLAVFDAMQVQPAVRSTARVLGPGYAVKRGLIAGTGGFALRRALVRRGLRHNPALLGVYDFRNTDYRSLMRGWLARLPSEGGLVFCHPGTLQGLDADDAHPAARTRELSYLASAGFLQDLSDAGVVLGNAWCRVAVPNPGPAVSEMSTSG